MDFTDFFDTTAEAARDRWGRPLLIPRGGTEADRQWYTRASSLADMIEDFSNVHTWQMRYLARGLASSMDLVRLAAAETYTTGFDKGEERENKASGKRLDDIIDRALDRAKVHEKADYGTAVHARTEPGNDGFDPDEFQAREVDSFWDFCTENGIVHLGTEVFTANDELRSAGTFDHLSYIPGVGIVVTDKKTSSKPKASYDVQLSTYANADVYDFADDSRTTLPEYIASLGWDPALLRRDIGFLFWIKNGKTSLRMLNLTEGYQAARVAAWVRDNHRTKGTAPDMGEVLATSVAQQRALLLERIEACQTGEDLRILSNVPTAVAVWTDEHTAAAERKFGHHG